MRLTIVCLFSVFANIHAQEIPDTSLVPGKYHPIIDALREEAFVVAENTIERFLASNPKDGWLFYLRGATAQIQNSTNGIEDLNICLLYNPNNADAYFRIGQITRDLVGFQESIPFFSKAISMAPRNAFYCYERALTYLAMNEFELAYSNAEQFLDVAPDKTENGWIIMIEAAHQLGNDRDIFQLAKKYYETFSIQSPNPEVFYLFGEIYNANYELDQACTFFHYSKDDLESMDQLITYELQEKLKECEK